LTPGAAGPRVTGWLHGTLATNDRLGTGKWQAGAATAAIAPQPWGLLGALVTYQHSFAGVDDRPTQNGLQTQPFVIYNLPQAFYLRSTATWNFDLQRGDYYIPLGLGGGKGWKLSSGTTINLFAEPQYAVAHDGIAPQWQLFMGLNFQFPLTPHGGTTAPATMKKPSVSPVTANAPSALARARESVRRVDATVAEHWSGIVEATRSVASRSPRRRPGRSLPSCATRAT